MPAPRKFDEETRARAVRLYLDRLRDHGESKLAARRHVGELLDIAPATLRNRIEAEERTTRPPGRVLLIPRGIRQSCGGCARRTRSCGERMRSLPRSS